MMMIQDCALVAPRGPWCLTLILLLTNWKKSYAGHPKFHTFRAVDSRGHYCHLTHH